MILKLRKKSLWWVCEELQVCSYWLTLAYNIFSTAIRKSLLQFNQIWSGICFGAFSGRNSDQERSKILKKYNILQIFTLPFTSIKETSVSVNLIFQADLNIQELFVFSVLTCHVISYLLYLAFHTANHFLYLGQLGTVLTFCLY